MQDSFIKLYTDFTALILPCTCMTLSPTRSPFIIHFKNLQMPEEIKGFTYNHLNCISIFLILSRALYSSDKHIHVYVTSMHVLCSYNHTSNINRYNYNQLQCTCIMCMMNMSKLKFLSQIFKHHYVYNALWVLTAPVTINVHLRL